MKKKLWIIGLSVIAFAGCYKENAEDAYVQPPVGGGCDTTNVTFSGVVKPIIDAKCATSGCHLGSATTGFDLSTYGGVAYAIAHGAFMPAINHTGPSPMPKGQDKLDDCTILKIQKWIDDGTLDN